MIGSSVVALLRRYIAPPKRLDIEGHARTDATVILVVILFIICSMFGQNGANISRGVDMANGARFASMAVTCARPDEEPSLSALPRSSSLPRAHQYRPDRSGRRRLLPGISAAVDLDRE